MADRVRAKFFVQEVGKTTYGGKVVLNVVSRGEDNKKWSAATPSGQITMTIRNELAMDFFDVGQEYFVTFDPAPKGEEGMGE
jgi:hypothetical protein